MLRRPFLFSCCVALLAITRLGFGAEPSSKNARVEVAPGKTFVGIASVSLIMPVFTRGDGIFETTYRASVVPWAMFNEKGRLSVDISDEMLRALVRGETIDFKGRAVREGGAERRIEGRATPSDAKTGKLRVRVFYSKRINLTFDTTYRFTDTPK